MIDQTTQNRIARAIHNDPARGNPVLDVINFTSLQVIDPFAGLYRVPVQPPELASNDRWLLATVRLGTDQDHVAVAGPIADSAAAATAIGP